MGESVLGYDEPDVADKSLHTWQREIDGTDKEDQVFVLGSHFHATYTAVASGISTAVSADHLIFIQADGTNYTRIQKIEVTQAALAGAAATARLQVIRTTTAGSGGSAISARPLDGSDTDPYAGTIQTLPTAKGTEGNTLDVDRLGLVAAQPVNALNRVTFAWDPKDGKEIIIAPATANGICLKIVTGIATSTVDIKVRFTVTSYL